MQCSGKVCQIWRFTMFLSILLPLSWNLTPSLCTILYVHELQRWQTFSLFALSELVCIKKVPYPIHYSLLIYPKLILLWSVTDGRTDWWTTFFTPCSLSSFFCPLSARGPTRRRNSTRLAKLWGGWPIELGFNLRFSTKEIPVVSSILRLMMQGGPLGGGYLHVCTIPM